MTAYARLNTAGLTTHTGLKHTPHPVKGSYQDGYQTACSLAPTVFFTGGKNFLPYAGFFKDLLLFKRYGGCYIASITPKTPKNRAKYTSRRAKTA